jgi:hypothetical protein
MKEQILKALRMKYQGIIEEAKTNIEIYFTSPVGIGEHPEILQAIDTQMEKIAEAEDKIVVIDNHFTSPRIP